MTTKTDITQERADFEAAYAAAYPVAASRPDKFDREDWGDYVDASVGIGWRMWQAGRWQAVRAAVEADRREQMNDNAACIAKLSESDKQDQSGGVTARIMRAAVEYADACITRTVAGCTGRPQSEQQIAAMAAEQAYADLHDLLSGQLAASIDIADVRQYLDQWGCLAHPGVRALVDRYSIGRPDPQLVCDDCGAATENPWHTSRGENRHVHLCDNCHATAAHEPVADAATTLAAICDLFGIGSEARDPGIILANVENAVRRSECLGAVERYLTVSTPPDPDEGDDEPGEECLLRWGVGPEGYAEHFQSALTKFGCTLDAPVAAQAQPIMPPLTDAMRAVLRNENTIYDSEDELYAALVTAARAAKGADHA